VAELTRTAGHDMTQGTRTRRVAERVRTELSTLLARNVRDPGVLGVTVTDVRMTADLQLARVYYTLLAGSDRRTAARGLRRARAYLRREIGQRLQLRQVPEIRFLYDDSTERQDRIARIFDDIERERRETGGSAGDDAAIDPEDRDDA
jgi:ribosome-binding factor A